MSRLLLINPGASNSTIDVYNGYAAALKRLNHEVYEYSLDRRIDRAGAFLAFNYKKSRKEGLDVPRPTPADILYWAGIHSIEMALRLEPEWIVVVSGMFLLKDTMRLLRKATIGKCKMALLLTESPYDDDMQQKVAPLFDIVTTNERTSLPRLRIANPNTFYLPHAYDATKHRPDLPIDDDTPAHDVLFIGTGFIERQELLAQVDWTGIDLALYGNYPLMGSRSKLRKYVRGGIVSNEKAAMLYRKARVNLNLYRESMGFGKDAPRISSAESLNPRAYELAALGAFQISSGRCEAREIFGNSVAIFQTPEQLQALIDEYTEVHPGLLKYHADKSREAVQGHTYDARAEQLTEVLGRERRAA